MDRHKHERERSVPRPGRSCGTARTAVNGHHREAIQRVRTPGETSKSGCSRRPPDLLEEALSGVEPLEVVADAAQFRPHFPEVHPDRLADLLEASADEPFDIAKILDVPAHVLAE